MGRLRCFLIGSLGLLTGFLFCWSLVRWENEKRKDEHRGRIIDDYNDGRGGGIISPPPPQQQQAQQQGRPNDDDTRPTTTKQPSSSSSTWPWIPAGLSINDDDDDDHDDDDVPSSSESPRHRGQAVALSPGGRWLAVASPGRIEGAVQIYEIIHGPRNRNHRGSPRRDRTFAHDMDDDDNNHEVDGDGEEEEEEGEPRMRGRTKTNKTNNNNNKNNNNNRNDDDDGGGRQLIQKNNKVRFRHVGQDLVMNYTGGADIGLVFSSPTHDADDGDGDADDDDAILAISLPSSETLDVPGRIQLYKVVLVDENDHGQDDHDDDDRNDFHQQPQQQPQPQSQKQKQSQSQLQRLKTVRGVNRTAYEEEQSEEEEKKTKERQRRRRRRRRAHHDISWELVLDLQGDQNGDQFGLSMDLSPNGRLLVATKCYGHHPRLSASGFCQAHVFELLESESSSSSSHHPLLAASAFEQAFRISHPEWGSRASISDRFLSLGKVDKYTWEDGRHASLMPRVEMFQLDASDRSYRTHHNHYHNAGFGFAGARHTLHGGPVHSLTQSHRHMDQGQEGGRGNDIDDGVKKDRILASVAVLEAQGSDDEDDAEGAELRVRAYRYDTSYACFLPRGRNRIPLPERRRRSGGSSSSSSSSSWWSSSSWSSSLLEKDTMLPPMEEDTILPPMGQYHHPLMMMPSTIIVHADISMPTHDTIAITSYDKLAVWDYQHGTDEWILRGGIIIDLLLPDRFGTSPVISRSSSTRSSRGSGRGSDNNNNNNNTNNNNHRHDGNDSYDVDVDVDDSEEEQEEDKMRGRKNNHVDVLPPSVALSTSGNLVICGRGSATTITSEGLQQKEEEEEEEEEIGMVDVYIDAIRD